MVVGLPAAFVTVDRATLVSELLPKTDTFGVTAPL
jgi:hypothetical protein